jgi:hypothetical protein
LPAGAAAAASWLLLSPAAAADAASVAPPCCSAVPSCAGRWRLPCCCCCSAVFLLLLLPSLLSHTYTAPPSVTTAVRVLPADTPTTLTPATGPETSSGLGLGAAEGHASTTPVRVRMEV